MGRWKCLLVVLISLTSAVASHAGDRFFFCKNGKAYFCTPPAVYSDGCYVVRDQTDVVRVNQYPVISSARAQEMIVECSPTVSSTVAHAPTSDCCDTNATTGDCFPHLLSKCHCSVACNPTPITGTPGTLVVKDKKKSFYDGIGLIDGTIPVPQLCANSQDEYLFRPKTLEYDCKEGVGTGCPDGCDPLKCPHGKCKVQSCEVYQKQEKCDLTCELCPRAGRLVIAVRAGGKIADVFIGKAGKATFPEYPENLVVIRGRTEADIRNLLKNPTITFADIVKTSTTTDLLTQM